MTRRVAITGIGVIAPGGIGTDAFWNRILSGRSATRTITTFDPTPFRSRMAGECDFDPAEHGLTPQEIRRMDRAAQFAVVCTRECLADSGLSTGEVAATRTGVTVGSAVGCTIKLENEYLVLSDGGQRWNVDPGYAVPHLYDYFVPSSLAAEVAWQVGAEGPVSVVSDGCTAGIDAIGYACQLIRDDEADVVIAGGTEAPIAPITVACFDAIRATSAHNDDPEHALRPYDVSRNGFVLGEGAAMFVLEELEHARRRGARIYATIDAVATRANAYHMTGLQADGREMAEAIRVVLDKSRVRPEQVDWVSMHGTGTKQNDRHETAAVKRTLGEHAYRTPASSIKSMVGHSLGAIGAIETAACALAITHGMVPPTANLHEQDPELDLDYVPLHAREWTVDVALNVGSGFGGFQSAMLLSRPEAVAR
ncbi:beta-ketoacyl synthase [Plantactinospora sp. KBS50]|uniref:beta-ketoacyl-[acyl-carrier-protein] synthase family protein n=1 Tax=Plantactinospora sp. KBS50 TaxID=2024580 RepID=UPI000BAB0059|nr:beta-ketoacyl-[acyl-carrier-protein] synthase family protein [Plantactinospora sp. KBS50]ASW54597.1 beta-ACP synthase [Plantactinospora sp. KBS50]